MSRHNSNEFDPESAIIDAELLVKYRMINRAIEALERAIDNAPRHIGLREKLREVLIDVGRRDQAAQQCLAVASLHISVGDIEKANERLIEAKRLDPRVSVTGPMRDMRRGDLHSAQAATQSQAAPSGAGKVLSGSLSDINLFDIIQILENSRLTGALLVVSSTCVGSIHFNKGQVVDSKAGEDSGSKALSEVLGAVDGAFEFTKSDKEYERTIKATSNTALILDMLRERDEANQEMRAVD
ncbi:MAG: hypothetical protein DMF61_10085 [Blastocatellia bacterium AA13]|nr:MAG: hypothetical protein DMF61_10085 [Blastocatellia bacterium AA13]